MRVSGMGRRPGPAGRLHRYETDMIDYGFRAVQTSLHAMNQAITEDQVQLIFSRAVLRIINCVPPLKRRVINRMGEE
jgi:hypothetical protein